MTGNTQIIAIVGATGTGKTELSLDVAQALAEQGVTAEIVNADAMQLYVGMNIGTAKLPATQRRGIPHHMFDVLDVTTEAAVADYQLHARHIIEEIHSRGNIAILVGGSGLYVSSVLFDFEFPGHDDQVREDLESEYEREGIKPLFARLKELAPEAAERIDPQNSRRVIRALEVLEDTGSTASLGTLPEDVAFITTFSSGIPSVIANDAARVEAVKAFLQFLASAGVEDVKRKQGMDWL